MNLFEKFIYLLQMNKVQTPPEWGFWHFVSIFAVIFACLVCSLLMRRASNKQLRVFLGVVGAVTILLEIIKQIVFCLSFTENGAVWDYQWYIFPFQFCSLAMYVSFAVGFVKQGLLQECLLSFLTSYSLVAGFIVMLVPSQVFCATAFINVQTMIHHGSMLVMAAVIVAGGHVKLGLKSVLKGTLVFGIFMIIALIANVVAVKVFNMQEFFNLFYISPYFDCPMPVFSLIYKAVPYPVFLLLYLVGFVGGSCLLVYLVKLACGLPKICRTKAA